jgi:hypothetical protein
LPNTLLLSLALSEIALKLRNSRVPRVAFTTIHHVPRPFASTISGVPHAWSCTLVYVDLVFKLLKRKKKKYKNYGCCIFDLPN